jgi:hypothetical protein
MHRSCIPAFLAAAIPLISVTEAAGQQACRPTLAFAEIQFSEMQPSRLERKWTAVVSVDASAAPRTPQDRSSSFSRGSRKSDPTSSSESNSHGGRRL